MTELNYYLICVRCGKIKEIGGQDFRNLMDALYEEFNNECGAN